MKPIVFAIFEALEPRLLLSGGASGPSLESVYFDVMGDQVVKGNRIIAEATVHGAKGRVICNVFDQGPDGIVHTVRRMAVKIGNSGWANIHRIVLPTREDGLHSAWMTVSGKFNVLESPIDPYTVVAWHATINVPDNFVVGSYADADIAIVTKDGRISYRVTVEDPNGWVHAIGKRASKGLVRNGVLSIPSLQLPTAMLGTYTVWLNVNGAAFGQRYTFASCSDSYVVYAQPQPTPQPPPPPPSPEPFVPGSILMSTWPQFVGTGGELSGSVTGGSTNQFVAVYDLNGTWQRQTALVAINSNNTWSTWLSDSNSSVVRAYLVPADRSIYDQTLPENLPYSEVIRSVPESTPQPPPPPPSPITPVSILITDLLFPGYANAGGISGTISGDASSCSGVAIFVLRNGSWWRLDGLLPITNNTWYSSASIDELVTVVRAYAIPNGVDVPFSSGTSSLPGDVLNLPFSEVIRSV